MRFFAPGFSLLLLALLSAASLSAQLTGQASEQTLGLDAPKVLDAPAGRPLSGEQLEAMTQEVSSLMRCPVCQGLSVADSPTDSAVAMKEEVRDLLALGYSQDQILTYFESSYGEFIRLAPKPTGFNLVVWIAPVLAILAGLALVLVRVRKGAVPATPVAEEANDSPELEGYLEQVRHEAKQ